MIIERRAIRAIVFTPEHETLLLHVRPPSRTPFWVTPGGGLEPDETSERGLRRELAEELGLEHFELGPLLARRQHAFDWGGNRIHQSEDIHLVQHPRFEPYMSDQIEAKTVAGFRWWTLDELATTRESITPRSLVRILRRYLAIGASDEEIALEVDTD
jgi:8-oxo-dGTP pyrophosphatase MutT (NUDIX family)